VAEGTFDRLAYPAESVSEISRVALLVDGTIDGDPAATVVWSSLELGLIEQAEQAVGHSLHKGHALHNLGVAVYAADPPGARVYFMAAHVEDARTWVNRRPRNGFLAARMLRLLFEFSTYKVGKLAHQARLAPNLPPLRVARQFAEQEWLPQFEDPLPGNRTAAELEAIDPFDRVFIGGSYRFAWDRINAMARGVLDAGRQPIVVAKFQTFADEGWRAKSFRILDQCPRAAFDVTVEDSPGHWPEIERIAQVTPKPTLFAFSADDPNREYRGAGTFPNAGDIPGLEYLPFDTHDVLRSGVAQWLLVRHPRVSQSGPTASAISPALGSATPNLHTAVGSNSSGGPAMPGTPLPTTSGFVEEPTRPAPGETEAER